MSCLAPVQKYTQLFAVVLRPVYGIENMKSVGSKFYLPKVSLQISKSETTAFNKTFLTNIPCLVSRLRCLESVISVLGNRNLYFAYVFSRSSSQFPAVAFVPARDCRPLPL